MPRYEYGCASCGQRLERRQSFHDAPLTVCPSCSGTLYRVIQPVGIVFRGSGWYCNDHRSASKAETKTESKSSESAASKSTEKPKAKAKT